MAEGKNKKIAIAWAILLAAIVAEVTGTSFMANAARGSGYTGYLVMAVALAVSYYLLSHAIRKISVGIAYAVWEGIGLAALTLVSVFVFEEGISGMEMFGLGMVLIGIACVALGEEH